MNEESLGRANRLLAAVAAKVALGEVFAGAPADIGRAAGIEDPLAVARAMRALLSRGRLEATDSGYLLRDVSPVRPDEKGTTPPRSRPERASRAATDGGSAATTYSEVGREAIDRLIELGKEVATLRAEVRTAREEVRTARASRIEAEHRAETLGNRVHELEGRAEMAESNLRTLLATARTGGGKDSPLATGEMEAILGVLKGETENAS